MDPYTNLTTPRLIGIHTKLNESSETASIPTSILVEINDTIYFKTLLPSMIYLVILLVVGLPGNAMVCYIYHKQIKGNFTGSDMSRAKKSSDVFILALAWLDVVNCFVSIPIEMAILRNFIVFDFPWICKVSRYIVMVLNAASSFVLLGIAIDRFIGIKFTHSKYRFEWTTAVKFVLWSVIIALVVSVPGVILYGTQSLPISRNVVGKTCLIDDNYKSTTYPFILSMYLLSMHLLFDLIFVVLYGLLGREVVTNKNFRSESSYGGKSRRYSRAHSEISTISFPSNSEICIIPTDMNKNVSLTAVSINLEKSVCSNQINNKVLKEQSSRRQPRNSDSAVHGKVYRAGKTTFMLFTVTIVFMLTFAPYCVIAIFRNVSQEDIYSNLSDTEKAFYQIFLRSYLLSSAVNPIIYSFFSDKFRQQAKQTVLDLLKCFKR